MFLVVFMLVAVVMLVVVQEIVRRRSARWRCLSQFPGDSPLPLIGNALQLGFDADQATKNLLEIWKRLGCTSFRMTVGSEDWVLLSEPEDVAVILSNTTELSKSPERNTAVKPFFGSSVSTSEGDRWRWTRKLMIQSFSPKTLQESLIAINTHSEQLLEMLSSYVDKGSVPIYRYLRPYMFDILCDTLMGVDYNLLDNPDHAYLKASGKVIDMITENYFSYWRNIQPIFQLTASYREMMDTIKTIRDTSREIIAQRRLKIKNITNATVINNKNVDVDVNELVQNKLSQEHCLLDTFLLSKLPNGEPIPDEIINEEISFAGFTGHFTTTMTISHTLYCIARYPEIQKRIIEEQHQIFKEDYLRKPRINDLNEMVYLEAVIKESIRVIPTVPKIGRKLKNDLRMKDGRVIPSETTVIVYYEAMFMSEKVFPEPHKFIPERFFESMHTYAYMPFGGGPRTCLGFRFAWVAMKATLSNILRRFEVIQDEGSTEPQFSYGIVTESKNGIHLKFKTRP